MKWLKSYRQWLTLAIVPGLVGLLLPELLAPFVYEIYRPDEYLGMHTLLELISVIISFSIVSAVWMVRDGLEDQQGRFVLYLGLSFLSVSCIDLFHALSYQGMPDFITPSSTQKAIFLWLCGRVAVALGVLTAPLWVAFSGRWKSLIVAGIVGFNSLFAAGSLVLATIYNSVLPEFYAPDQGLTQLKLDTEYFLVASYILSFIPLWLQRNVIRTNVLINLISFVAFTLMSEMLFTFYENVYDTYNLLGHIYKAVAYCFLYRAILWSGIINHFYTMSEMAYASEELLKENISFQTAMCIHMEKLRKILPQAGRIAIYLKESEQSYRCAYVWGSFSCELPLGSLFDLGQFFQGMGPEPALIDNPIDLLEQLKKATPVKDIPLDLPIMLKRATQLAYVPLSSGKALFGMLVLYVFNPCRLITPDDMEKLLVFQRFISLAVTRIKNEETITRLSFEDALTELPNRRQFFDRLRYVRQVATQTEIPFTIFSLDMNDLKFVNDHFGHAAGDAALTAVASALRREAGADGLAARLGGDEFGMLFGGMSMEEGNKKAAALKEALAAIPLTKYDRNLTMAVGGASYPDDATDECELLTIADNRMYEHKRSVKAKAAKSASEQT